MPTLEEAAAALRVLIPGFLALKVFYWFGLKTQRTDLELILWSLVLSLPLYAFASWALPQDDIGTLTLAIVAGLAVGILMTLAWRLVVHWRPEYRDYMLATAWDSVLTRPGGGWFQVRTTDGVIYQGWTQMAADSAQTADLDLYLWEPEYVDADGQPIPITEAEGVLIPKSSIASIIRFAPNAPAADHSGQVVVGTARTVDPAAGSSINDYDKAASA